MPDLNNFKVFTICVPTYPAGGIHIIVVIFTRWNYVNIMPSVNTTFTDKLTYTNLCFSPLTRSGFSTKSYGRCYLLEHITAGWLDWARDLYVKVCACMLQCVWLDCAHQETGQGPSISVLQCIQDVAGSSYSMAVYCFPGLCQREDLFALQGYHLAWSPHRQTQARHSIS